jgi:aryl-alcohol dehydrogenase-like predicted oxidoreductase
MRSRGSVRDRIFLATKGSALIQDLDEAWADRSVVPRYVGASSSVLRRSMDDSLRRLGVDHVDLYYVHVDDRSTPLEETLSTLASFVSSGKARHIGYSNVRTWRFERIRQLCVRNGWPAPVALQQQHSYLRRRAGLSHASIVDDEQLDYLRANPSVSLVAYSPMLKGYFDDRAKDGALWTYAGPDTDARLEVLGKEAASMGVTPGQLVLAWLLHQSSPAMIPLIGPRTYVQYEAAMAALDISLDEATLRRLDAAGA